MLKWIVLPVVVVVLWVGVKLFSRGDDAQVATNAAQNNATPLTAEEIKALGIQGDTSRDTVATLVAEVGNLRTQVQTAMDANKAAESENARLRAREGAIDQRINSALSGERQALAQQREQLETEQAQSRSTLEALKNRLESLIGGVDPNVELPIGLGLDEQDLSDAATSFAPGAGNRIANSTNAGGGGNAIRWIEPDDQILSTRNGNAAGAVPKFPNQFDTSFGEGVSDAAAPAAIGGESTANERGVAAASSLKRVYTVPANSTLLGSTAMTALVGRVPIDGTVNDPYPFKVLVGPDNLTANGIDIPDVAGAVMSGTATGDWTLSCVRGQIRSVTFVFNDGTVRTIPESNTDAESGGNGSTSTQLNGFQSGLGWISDPHGVPCVSGERRSNAAQFLTTQSLVTAAGVGAATLLPNNGGRIAAGGVSGFGTVDAMGQVLADGVSDVSDWVNKLYGQTFAAVYAPPGAPIAVHLERTLQIDYDPAGRRVDYRIGESHATNLD